ncbi:MAG TPA: biopolymer transporter ExbD [Candidatus Omnitrophota bacterium]|nr:biopolymer transporter ExbD [Candidatus Omnitrophota bacterium]
MRFKRTVFLAKGQIDLTPLINMVFLLLIFFMMTSSFISQPGIRINLPKAVTSEVLQKNIMVIGVASDNRLYVNERLVTQDELYSRIVMAARDSKGVLIKADENASLGTITAVWDLCRKADVKQISMATAQ